MTYEKRGGVYHLSGDRYRIRRRVDGQTITENFRGTKKEARARWEALGTAAREGKLARPGAATLARYLESTWLPHARTRVRATTLRRYEALLRVHVVPRIGDVKLSKLRPSHVQSVLDGMIAAGAAPASVLQAHRVLSSALGQALRWQLVAVNPCAAVRPPRPDRAPLRTPSADETRAIVQAASGIYEVPVLLAAATGMRRGEILGLQWSAVDLDNGRIQVSQTLQKVRGEVRFVAPKTDRSRRTVSLPASTVERLRRHRVEQAERRLLLGAAWRDLDLVVDGGRGEHLDPDSLTHAFAKIAKKAGLLKVRLHDLRHAFASTLLVSGVHPKVVSEALGHSSVAFTMDVYSHVMPSMGDQVAVAIEQALHSVQTS
jgi:integrase